MSSSLLLLDEDFDETSDLLKSVTVAATAKEHHIKINKYHQEKKEINKKKSCLLLDIDFDESSDFGYVRNLCVIPKLAPKIESVRLPTLCKEQKKLKVSQKVPVARLTFDQKKLFVTLEKVFLSKKEEPSGIKVVAVEGPCGSGKTFAISEFSRQTGKGLYVIDAADLEDASSVFQKLYELTCSKKNVIAVIDGISDGQKFRESMKEFSSTKLLLSFLSSFVKKYKKEIVTPFVIVTSEWNKAMDSILKSKTTERVKISAPSANDFLHVFQKPCPAPDAADFRQFRVADQFSSHKDFIGNDFQLMNRTFFGDSHPATNCIPSLEFTHANYLDMIPEDEDIYFASAVADTFSDLSLITWQSDMTHSAITSGIFGQLNSVLRKHFSHKGKTSHYYRHRRHQLLFFGTRPDWRHDEKYWVDCIGSSDS